MDNNFTYDNFYRLHKNNLKEIFVSIRNYLKKEDNKDHPYAFFKKHNIILNNTGFLPVISNFGHKFLFTIDYKDIKEIKLYINEKRFYIFWTCSNYFTQYFFTNHLKRRICIKNEDNSFKSFNLNESDNYRYSTYYLYPPKSINYSEIIESFIDINFNNPPKQLSFLIEKGKYYSNYKNPIIVYGENNFETFFHNQKIGVSLSLIFDMKNKYIMDIRILYLNIHYLFVNNTYIRKEYLLYFLNFLFKRDENEKATKFLIDIYFNFNNYDNQYDKLIKKIFQLFKNDEIILIIFDNIHSLSEYESVKNIKEKLKNELKNKQNIFMKEFISINEDTLDIMKLFYEKKEKVEILGRGKSGKLKDDLGIIIEFMKDEKNYIGHYKEIIDDGLKTLLTGYSIEKNVKLIKLLYYVNNQQLNKEDFEEIIIRKDLKLFIKYLYINIDNNKINIEFRNNIIHSLFIYYFTFYYTQFNNSLSENCIIKFLDSEKGFNFERNIIYSFLIGKFSSQFSKVNIQRLYCFGKCEDFSLNRNILFYQNIPNAPKYDFALLIQNNEKEYILKSYQVSIIKPEAALKELGNTLITYDLRYFCDKINRIKNIEIKYYSFGIIISYDSFKNRNKDVEIISNFCLTKNYEFLLYNIKDNKLYYNESISENSISLKEISTFEGLGDTYLNIHKPVIKNEAKIPQKYYIKKVIDTKYIENIKSIFKNTYKIDTNPLLIAKFKSDISQFEQDNDENLIFYYISKENKNANIYYHNYKINEDSIEIDISCNNLISQVLVYRVNRKKMNNIDFSKKEKLQLNLTENNKEKDRKYLISENKEELYYDEQIENNDCDSVDAYKNTIIKEKYQIFSLDQLTEIKSENFLGKPVEFIVNNNLEKEISNTDPNSQSCEDSFEDSLFNEIIYDEKRQDNEELTKENLTIDGMYDITPDIYKQLLYGNEKVLSALLNKINEKESKENNLLNKKRNNSSKKKEKEGKLEKNEKQTKKVMKKKIQK